MGSFRKIKRDTNERNAEATKITIKHPNGLLMLMMMTRGEGGPDLFLPQRSPPLLPLHTPITPCVILPRRVLHSERQQQQQKKAKTLRCRFQFVNSQPRPAPSGPTLSAALQQQNAATERLFRIERKKKLLRFI